MTGSIDRTSGMANNPSSSSVSSSLNFIEFVFEIVSGTAKSPSSESSSHCFDTAEFSKSTCFSKKSMVGPVFANDFRRNDFRGRAVAGLTLGEPSEVALCCSSGTTTLRFLLEARREALLELLRGGSMRGTLATESGVATEPILPGDSSSYSGILKGTLPLLIVKPGLLGEPPGLPLLDPVSLKLTIAIARRGSSL